MKDKKSIVLVILSIAAIISLIHGIGSLSKTKSRKFVLRQNFQRGEVKNIDSEGIQTFLNRQEKRIDYSDWGRNPFVLPEIRDSLEVVLNGILWDKENPRAIINNKNVRIGDKAGVYTVEEISEDKVVLTDGIRRLELRVE